MEQIIFIFKIAVEGRPGDQRGVADIGQGKLLKGQSRKLGKERSF